MASSDIFFIFQWWLALFAIGLIHMPFSNILFSRFLDKGYIFSKIIGIVLISYIMFLLGTLRILPFTLASLVLIIFFLALCNISIIIKSKHITTLIHMSWRYFVAEEIFFFLGLLFWSFVRATQPDVHGLEKYMDFGFVNSILRTRYFPATDMWYPPFSINYYYFGHLVTALLTKLTSIPSSISFNLMLATIFAFTFSGFFSLAITILGQFFSYQKAVFTPKRVWKFIYFSKTKFYLFLGGLLTAYIGTLGGNLHTLYAFFKPYNVDNPVPFWNLPFAIQAFPNAYWYPNATRFIYHTIHEFPLYSFVVSDLHGHVLDIPFVLLTIAILFMIFIEGYYYKQKITLPLVVLVGFLLSILYMTNAWDGIIYLLLAGIIFLSIAFVNEKGSWSDKIFSNTVVINMIVIAISFVVFSLPFSLFFKPFASQIGILCAPGFLTKIGHLGPILFEPDHCQKSPWWQLLTLHGFFLYWLLGFSLFMFLRRKKQKIFPTDIFIFLLGSLSIFLIIVPEFVYLKDIYPTYYRANTMFKLVYQSFIMLSLCSGYIVIRLLFIKNESKNIFLLFYRAVGIPLFFIIAIYPYFAINSYYSGLQNYSGLNGLTYLQKTYPSDMKAINWINTVIEGQPIMLEAQGDSYTDYERVSTNTGLPTVLGWTVHEWLWRGSYNPLPERITDVENIYTTHDPSLAFSLLKKYNVQFVFIGSMEHQKYPQLQEAKFSKIGKLIFVYGETRIYQVAY